MSACKDCANYGALFHAGKCMKHPVKRAWSAHFGEMIAIEYKSCIEVNTGPHDCPEFEARTATPKDKQPNRTLGNRLIILMHAIYPFVLGALIGMLLVRLATHLAGVLR